MRNFIQDINAEVTSYYDFLIVFTPKLLLAVVVLIIAWLIARTIRRISDRRLKKQMHDPLLADFLSTMIQYIFILIGFLLALRILGFGGITASILAGAGISAFIVGFAMRDIGENFLAGILMAFKRPFRVGDFVETGAIKGRVLALNIRDTRLKTTDGKDVYIPNAMIIKNPLINYTIDGYLRYDVVLNLPSGSDYNALMETFRLSAEAVDGVIRKRRKVTVYVSAVNPAGIEITVSFWVDTFTTRETSDRIRSDVMLRLQEIIGRKDDKQL